MPVKVLPAPETVPPIVLPVALLTAIAEPELAIVFPSTTFADASPPELWI
jgi:hypothetical protein